MFRPARGLTWDWGEPTIRYSWLQQSVHFHTDTKTVSKPLPTVKIFGLSHSCVRYIVSGLLPEKHSQIPICKLDCLSFAMKQFPHARWPPLVANSHNIEVHTQQTQSSHSTATIYDRICKTCNTTSSKIFSQLNSHATLAPTKKIFSQLNSHATLAPTNTGLVYLASPQG